MISQRLVSNSIILSASLFGSFYLFSTSLVGLNKKWSKDGKVEGGVFELINGIILAISGVVVVITAKEAFDILSKQNLK